MPVSCSEPITLNTLCPQLSAKRSVAFRSVQQQYGDGYLARRQDGINPVMITWDVSTPPMSIEDCQALEAELIANGTRFFLWKPPFEVTEVNWILDPVSWDWTYDSPTLAQISFTLKRWYGN